MKHESIVISAERERFLFSQVQKTGCNKSKDEIARSQLALVQSLVSRFCKARQWNDHEAAFSAGLLGLTRAIDGFDLSYNVRFVTYVHPWVERALRRAYCNRYTIHIPEQHFTNEKNATFSEDAQRALRYKKITPNSACRVQECRLSHKESMKFIQRQINKLTDRQRDVINMVFFEGKTQLEACKILGISNARVGQLKHTALENLRKNKKLASLMEAI
jgi:RNA polymerase sporulation-specific sigma factor